MQDSFRPDDGWGPDRRRGALSITFDNLGEAAELEMGMWEGKPVGQHPTVPFIHTLIDVLDDIRTTYFMEASNTALYPKAIQAWNEAGQEVGMHAWRHEVWAQCAPERRAGLLADSQAAMRALGVIPVGFRPPGGVIPAEAWQEFAAAGLHYCSELGNGGVGRIGSVVSIPFVWQLVDVYMIEDVMAPMRTRLGDPAEPFDLDRWRDNLEKALRECVADGTHRTVIFHPNFLCSSDEKLAVLQDFIASARSQDIWIAPMRDVAAFASKTMIPGQN